MSPLQKQHILATRLGFYVRYPAPSDPLTLTQNEIERYILDTCDEYQMAERTSDDFVKKFAHSAAVYMAGFFAERVAYRPTAQRFTADKIAA